MQHTLLKDAGFARLRSALQGRVIGPEDPEYDQARRVWNGMIDRRPRLIALCESSPDVLTAVRYAREHGLPVSVRGGGHHVAGTSVCDDGMVIDLSRMKSVEIDQAALTVDAGPGLTLGELDRATQPSGLAIPLGIVSTTGIAGLTLGGGIGWLMRRHGLACDNMIAAEVVTADGRLITVDGENEPELLWGLRGAGANFGIVTRFTYRVHRVGPVVQAGFVAHSAERAREIYDFYRDYAARSPDEVATVAAIRIAPAKPPFPRELQGKPILMIIACHCGDLEAGERALRPLREFGAPAVCTLRPVSFVDHQAFLDPGQPAGHLRYWKSVNLPALTRGAIDTILEHVPAVMSPQSLVALFQLGGAVDRVGEDATAYRGRGDAFTLNMATAWVDPGASDRYVAATRRFAEAMAPHSAGTYANFQAETDDAHTKAAYGESKYGRLVDLKRRWDPDNFFRLNHNIRP